MKSKQKKNIAGSVKPGKPPARKYGLPAVGDGLLHSWIKRSYTAFRFRHKGTAKEKNCQKPVKAPLWHKHKRNGPCFISLNSRLGVRQSPFLSLCDSRHTLVQNLFGRWCAEG